MTPRQFAWHLQTRGPTLDAWPDAERLPALALLRLSTRARTLLADALMTDDDAFDHADDAGALARIQRRIRTQLALRATAAPALRWSLRGGALAACLIAGLWAGGLAEAEADGLVAVQVAALDVLP